MALGPRRTAARKSVSQRLASHRALATRSTAPTWTAAALLPLLRLASPSLPVGGFSYSEALEAAVESGFVRTEDDTRRWLADQLQVGLARSEIAVVAKALAAWHRGDVASVDALNRWVTTTRESHELRAQSEQMGRSLVAWLKNRGGSVDPRVAVLEALAPAPTWPVAFALALAQTTAPPREALFCFAFSWAEAMVQAALKAVPLGQSGGQRVLEALVAEIPAAVDHAASLMESERQAFAPMLAILSAQHETQYSRLFRS